MKAFLNILIIFLFTEFCYSDVINKNNKLIYYSSGTNLQVNIDEWVYLDGDVKFMHNSVNMKDSEKEFTANEWIELDAAYGWYKIVPVSFEIKDKELTLKPTNTKYIDLNEFYHLRRSENFKDWTYPIKNEKWVLPFSGVKYNISKEFEVFELLTSEKEINF